jgi:hypothetical protein
VGVTAITVPPSCADLDNPRGRDAVDEQITLDHAVRSTHLLRQSEQVQMNFGPKDSTNHIVPSEYEIRINPYQPASNGSLPTPSFAGNVYARRILASMFKHPERLTTENVHDRNPSIDLPSQACHTLLLYNLNLHLIIRLASAPHTCRPTILFFKDISARHKTSTFESFAASVLRQLPFRSRSAYSVPPFQQTHNIPQTFSPPHISTPFRHANRAYFWGPCFITTHVTLG